MDPHMHEHHTARALSLALLLGTACFEDAGPGPDGPTDATDTSASAEEGSTGSEGASEASSEAPGTTGTDASGASNTLTGASTTPGEATETGWGPGPYYADCDASLLCEGPEECLYYGASRVCSAPCEETADCPPAPPGGAIPHCAEASPEPYEPRECILACEYVADNCPAGMTCRAISGLYFCLWEH